MRPPIESTGKGSRTPRQAPGSSRWPPRKGTLVEEDWHGFVAIPSYSREISFEDSGLRYHYPAPLRRYSLPNGRRHRVAHPSRGRGGRVWRCGKPRPPRSTDRFLWWLKDLLTPTGIFVLAAQSNMNQWMTAPLVFFFLCRSEQKTFFFIFCCQAIISGIPYHIFVSHRIRTSLDAQVCTQAHLSLISALKCQTFKFIFQQGHSLGCKKRPHVVFILADTTPFHSKFFLGYHLPRTTAPPPPGLETELTLLKLQFKKINLMIGSPVLSRDPGAPPTPVSSRPAPLPAPRPPFGSARSSEVLFASLRCLIQYPGMVSLSKFLQTLGTNRLRNFPLLGVEVCLILKRW